MPPKKDKSNHQHFNVGRYMAQLSEKQNVIVSAKVDINKKILALNKKSRRLIEKQKKLESKVRSQQIENDKFK